MKVVSIPTWVVVLVVVLAILLIVALIMLARLAYGFIMAFARWR